MRHQSKRVIAWLLALMLLVGLTPAVLAADEYTVTVTADKTEAAPGDTVSLTAEVTKNGEAVTDLKGSSLNLWFWGDSWGDHSDGNNDAEFPVKDDEGYTLTATAMLPTAGTYYLAAELQSGGTRVAIAYATITVKDAPKVEKDLSLPNGDFEDGNADKWTLTGYTGDVKIDQWDDVNTTNTLNLWISNDEDAEGSASYTKSIPAGNYYFTFDMAGADSNSGLTYAVTAGEKELAKGAETITTTGYEGWATYETTHFTLTETTEVTFTLSGTEPAKYWGNLDNLKLIDADDTPKPAPEPVESEIYVPYIEGTDDDSGFIRGTDVSSLLSILNSGATFEDFEGKSVGEGVDGQGKGFMKLLKDAGVNWVRLRVWNDPFDKNHNGYGGGNCDINAAVTMGKWATEAGIRVLIDFHYSDFWADPGKQQAPKAWKDYNVDQKADAIYKFTKECLEKLKDAGVDVGMIQVGNETTSHGICDENSSWEAKGKLFSAGSKAAREVDPSILVAIHFTNPERAGNYASYAKGLADANVDYDVFASSYYPYWHGTIDNLTSVLKNVADTYGKKVMVAETSWAWTLDEGDGHENTVRVGNNDSGAAYAFSVQGQATEYATVAKAVKDVGDKGLGLFYWENAWIPVNNVSGLEGSARDEMIAKNKELWEKYGSGWASSYASEYDPDDAGKWYGGSAVDNQAMFDFDGKALESLNVFKYMTTGTVGYVNEIVTVAGLSLELELGAKLVLPESVTVTYTDGKTADLTITWDEDSVKAVNTNKPGSYVVTGTITDGTETVEVTCPVVVNGYNYLQNPGFEEGNVAYDLKDWVGKGITDRESTNNHKGSWCLHFYSGNAISEAKASQTVKLQPGVYSFSLYAQGGDVGENPDVYIYVTVNGETVKESVALEGWANWKTPVIEFTVTEEADVTVGVNVTAGGGAWGSFDDWTLYKLSTYTDLVENAWYTDAVNYVTEKGLMQGTAPMTFSPEAIANRSMMVTVLWRLAGEPEAKSVSPFVDVTESDYYYTAVNWANENGYVLGIDPTHFDPYSPVSREVVVTIFYRYYTDSKGEVDSGNLGAFTDKDAISSWAVDAMSWAVENGIIEGQTPTTLVPGVSCRRAELATFFMRCCETLE